MKWWPPDPVPSPRKRGMHVWPAAVIGAMTLLLSFAPVAHAQRIVEPNSPCEQAGLDAEREYALPAGLLTAIGRVESGRWDAALGRVTASPYAIDAAGQPHVTDSKEAALQQTRALQQSGLRNIDVGCFQINLQSHPLAFSNLDQAFDPTANAQYAARFLSSLHTKLGSWEDAVAAYHSATPALGVPYRQLVYANWSTPEGWQHALAAAPNLSPPPREIATGLRVFSVGGHEVHVWTPSASGRAPAVVAIAGTSAPPLPHILTPAR
jgi:Transglycosylase SLT domain